MTSTKEMVETTSFGPSATKIAGIDCGGGSASPTGGATL
jgi:hypothetical protein